MTMRYFKLFDILNRRGLKKKDLMEMTGITAPTMSKLNNGETITTEVLERICKALDVQPGDIMEHVEETE